MIVDRPRIITKPSTPLLPLHPHIWHSLLCSLTVFYMSQTVFSFWAGGGQTQPGVKESQANLLGCGQREPNHRLCSASLQGQVTNVSQCESPSAEFILSCALLPTARLLQPWVWSGIFGHGGMERQPPRCVHVSQRRVHQRPGDGEVRADLQEGGHAPVRWAHLSEQKGQWGWDPHGSTSRPLDRHHTSIKISSGYILHTNIPD